MKPNKDKNKQGNLLLGIAAIVALAGIAWFSLQLTEKPSTDSPAAKQQVHVQLQTLPPAMFTGKTRDAYQAAKDVPEVLEQIPCYCGCMQNSGHQHNLFCFLDEHAVG